MRDELQKRLEEWLMANNFETPTMKSELFLILNDYEITSRTTELALCDEDSIDKFIKMFLISKRVSGRTEKTLKHYNGELRRFFNTINKNPTEITSNDIKMYIATLEVTRQVGKVYQKNILRALSSFFGWMVKEEFIVKNPLNKVEEIKLPKVKKHAFTEYEIEKIRNIITDPRDKAIFEVMLSTWCRVSEIAGMDKSKLNSDGSIEVLGKGQKYRTVYMNAKARLAVDEYLKKRDDNNEALFVTLDQPHNRITISNIESRFREYGRCAGASVHPHKFRRTGATFALRRGMPILQVSKLLGHESVETTQIYLDISDDELMQAHKKYI